MVIAWLGRGDQRVESNFYKTTRRGEKEEILRRLDNGQRVPELGNGLLSESKFCNCSPGSAGHSAS